LDLGETESELFTESPAPAASVEPEPQDVNVKLDLVAAYIDMDDKEGARELLEEVMKEGGTTQKARAQQLLDSLA
jgi:pilus assembly protein FimV